MLHRLSVFLLLPALLACSKSDSDPTIDFGKGEGITYRDNSNRPAGPDDSTDWTVDGSWNSKEQELFKSLPLNVNDAPQGSLNGAGAYPNPASTEVVFQYATPAAALCKFVVVDKAYRVILENTSPTAVSSPRYALDLTKSAFQKGQRYRLYYVMYNGAALYCKGHGDIKIAD